MDRRESPMSLRWLKPGRLKALPFVPVGLGVIRRMGEDKVPVLAGGVAFYAFLSIFPAIAGALMIWGALVEGAQLRDYLELVRGIAPERVFDLVSKQMVRIAQSQNGSLSVGAIASLVFALWSSSRAAVALMAAMSVAYNPSRDHGFVVQNLLAIGFTVTGIAFAVISLAAIGAVPPLLDALRLGAGTEVLIRLLRWLVLIGLFFAATLAAYAVARPAGTRERPRRLVPGAVLAALIWLAASFAFSFYLSQFDAYNQTFGSLGAVAALLMWLWISALTVCIGAELNAELEARRRE